MTASAIPRVEVTIARSTVPLRQDELDRLLGALGGLDLSGAASIAEEISALRLAGVRIQLLPSENELVALRKALLQVEHTSRAGSGLSRLRVLCESARA